MTDFAHNFGRYFSNALDAAYFEYEDIVAWADKIIIQCEAPRAWLVCLSLIKNPADYESPDLREALNEIIFWDCRIDCYEGFLFLKYLEGRASAAETLSSYIEHTTHEDALWPDLLPAMQRQCPTAKAFVQFMQRDDLYAAAPWVFSYQGTRAAN